MNKLNKLYILLFGLLMIPTLSKAQFDLGILLEAGVEDTEQYLDEYLSPAFLGFGYGMNGSWYNTAKPHKLLGFDFTVSGTFAKVPDPGRMFTFNNADYNNLELVDLTSAELPTLYGPNTPADDLPELRFTNPDTGEEIIRMSALSGLGLEESEIPILKSNSVPAPMFQIGLGLVKNTEIKFRFIPEQTFDIGDDQTSSSSLIGFGIMHDVKQWIPGMSALPFELSAFYGFTSVNSDFVFDPDKNQSLGFSVNASTFQAIISMKVAVLTGYASLGYSTGKASLTMLGDYDVDFQPQPLVDPVSFDVQGGSMRASLGARLKLLIFTFHGEYVIQQYPMWSVGFGINVR
jgi:hypothetical protein